MRSQELIGGISVEIKKKSNLKNLYIKINPPEGNVVVSTPIDYPYEEIRLFVLKKIPEITKVRDKMISQARQTKREYVSGETYYLWGRSYKLQVVYEGNKYQISKKSNNIILIAPKESTKESKERALNNWYRNELARVLDGTIKKCENKTNLQANEYRIKNMKTNWGTCNIDEKRIWVNLQLVKKPPECLEYVLIHELVHLLEKNHSNKFNSIMENFYPTWKETKKLLNDLPLDYLE